MNKRRVLVTLVALLVLLLPATAMLVKGVEMILKAELLEETSIQLETITYISTEVVEETTEPVEEASTEEMTEESLVMAEEVTELPIEATEETVEPVKEVPVTEPATEVTQAETSEEDTTTWQGQVLTARLGTVDGPSGKETWYNLPMSGVVKIMRNLGYSEEEYPYYVREDGCKMLGQYIICAANLEIRPRGTIVETSLGLAIVADTGGFAKSNKYQLDIAVDW